MRGPVLAFCILALAAGAAAVPPRISGLKTRDTISQEALTKAKLFAQYAGAAYCNSQNAAGKVITCAEAVCNTATSNQATTMASFTGSKTDMGGFVAVDPVAKVTVLSFRGTSSILNWIANFNFPMSPYGALCAGCRIHSGFLASWMDVQPAVLAAVASARAAHPSYALVVTGHSLGGAVATIAAAHLRGALSLAADLYTYGSPRVGNEAFAAFVTAQAVAQAAASGAAAAAAGYYRLTHFDDPIPRLPPIVFGYRHASPEYWLDDGTATTTSYQPSDVRVCAGTANVRCNAGRKGFDVAAHAYYFEHISGCNDGLLRRRDRRWQREEGGRRIGRPEMRPEEIEAKVDEYAELDRQYVANMTASSMP